MSETQPKVQLGIAEDTGSSGEKSDKARAAGRPKATGTALNPRRSRAGALQKSERELLWAINEKLDRVVAVLAAQGRDRDTQVAILAAAGCDSAFVGMLVGMSAGAVRKLPAWRRSQSDGTSSSQGGDSNTEDAQ